MPASHGSRPEYDVSRWPLNMSVGPSPSPARVASTFARPSSTCCHWTARPSSSHWPAYHAAAASSEPVKLGIETTASASATSRSRSIIIAGRSSKVREHPVAEQPDLLVPAVAPQLEHHMRAAGLAVLLDRRDAVRRRARDRLALVEDLVRHLLLRGQPAPALHRVRDRPDLRLREPCQLEQRVRRALDVLHLVREVHAGDLARAVAAARAVGLVD